MINLEKKEIILVKKLQKWGRGNLVGIFILNLTLMVLILLHAAGYFQPYFPITINIIVFIALVAAVILFDARSRLVFFIGLLFWLFAGMLRILSVNVWAERAAVYAYQALILGVFVLIIEVIKRNVK